MAKILKYPEKDAKRHGPNENNEENSQIEITYSIFHTQIPFSFCKRPACLEHGTWKLLATICFDHVHGNYR